MLRKWYLACVCLQSSAASNLDAIKSGLCYCSFLAKHKDDVSRSDELSRWWHDWYRYTRDKLTGNVIFGARILLRPNITPDHKNIFNGQTHSICSTPIHCFTVHSISYPSHQVIALETALPRHIGSNSAQLAHDYQSCRQPLVRQNAFIYPHLPGTTRQTNGNYGRLISD